MTGVVSLLAVVSSSRTWPARPAATPGTVTTASQALVAVRDWTFLFGPGFMACINAVLLGTLMYQSRFGTASHPRDGPDRRPLLIAANVATLFGHNEQTSAISMLATIPIACWERSVGTWMIVKGSGPRRSP